MDWITAAAVYFVAWWVVFLAVLPFGVERHQETQAGLEPGAPANPQLGKKALITTVVAGIVLALIYGIILYMEGFYDDIHVV